MNNRTLILAAALACTSPAWATDEHQHMDHSQMDHGAMPAMAISAEGKVNGVDRDLNTVNISHGPIAALHWPPMTMDLTLKDAAVADGIQPGDHVRFEMEQTGPTDYVIVKMEKL